jgi:hypothetical protein
VNESGVIAGKYRRALDSTVLDDAVQRQDTMTLITSQIRRARKLVSELSHIYVHEANLAGGRPPCDFEDSDDIISELVDDAYELVFAADELELTETQSDAAALLALVAGTSRSGPRRTGSFRASISSPLTPMRLSTPTATATRHISPLSPRPGSSPPPSSRPATQALPSRHEAC